MIDKYYIRIGIVGLFCLLLCSCRIFTPAPNPTITVAKIPDTVPIFLCNHPDIKSTFKHNAIFAYQKGDEILIVIPTAKYFYPNSAHFCTKRNKALDAIVTLLNNYQLVDIKVAGYTNNLGSPLRNIALSRERAQAFTDYLWQNGLNARIMYATGYGDFNPIANNTTSAGEDLNNRVEISLRLPPANFVW